MCGDHERLEWWHKGIEKSDTFKKGVVEDKIGERGGKGVRFTGDDDVLILCFLDNIINGIRSWKESQRILKRCLIEESSEEGEQMGWERRM